MPEIWPQMAQEPEDSGLCDSIAEACRRSYQIRVLSARRRPTMYFFIIYTRIRPNSVKIPWPNIAKIGDFRIGPQLGPTNPTYKECTKNATYVTHHSHVADDAQQTLAKVAPVGAVAGDEGNTLLNETVHNVRRGLYSVATVV